MYVPPFSYSILKAFETCPRQYHEIKVLRSYPTPKTEQILYGERLHKAAEDYVNGVEVIKEFDFLKPMLDGLLAKPGVKYPERKLAVTKELKPCEWKDRGAWFKGIADLSIVGDKKAFVCDYKSGGDKYADTDQLELMSLLIFSHHPEVEEVLSALLFVTRGTMVKREVKRKDAAFLWKQYAERNERRETAHHIEVFNPKQSGLCKKNCQVLTCEFNGLR